MNKQNKQLQLNEGMVDVLNRAAKAPVELSIKNSGFVVMSKPVYQYMMNEILSLREQLSSRSDGDEK